MALVSPGVEVTVVDESAYVPATATTVPLIFLATASEKSQPDGSPAMGTYEYGKIREVTSVNQSVRLFGTPVFLEDSSGNAQHGDARNEYGLFALNHFLAVGSRAYTVRANVNLNDNRDAINDLWDAKTIQQTLPYGAAYLLEIAINDYIETYNVSNGYLPSDIEYKTEVDQTEILQLIDESLTEVFGKVVDGTNVYFEESTFRTTRPDLFADHTATPLSVFANGFDQPATGDFFGIEGEVIDYLSGSPAPTGWTAVEGRDFLIQILSDFKFTVEYQTATTLGATDADRRSAIVEALASEIVSNQTIRSNALQYNLVLAPGYYEVVDELVSLAQEMKDEVFVIGETPTTMTPEEIKVWAATSARQRYEYLAYYYPHGIGTNLNGKEVFVTSSAIALRTITYSDDVSEIWFAPAGTRRGVVTGISRVGRVTGTLGTATTFEEILLSDGQIDSLYEFDTNINPIVNFTNQGIIIWGQKTSAVNASALDRINVARLVAYIARSLRIRSRVFVFQPNDQLTRDNWKGLADNFLTGIMAKRGLYDYATQCDEGNNTPDRIDRNEMYLNVAVAPTKSAEFLYIPIRVVNTGEI